MANERSDRRPGVVRPGPWQAETVAPPVSLVEVIARERAARMALDEKLTLARTAMLAAETRHASSVATAAEQLAQHRAQYEIDIARARAVRAMVDEQLREAALEVERARLAEASAAAVVERLTRNEALVSERSAARQAAYEAQIQQEVARRRSLEETLTRAGAAHETLQRQVQDLEAEFARNAAEHQAQLEALMRQERATRADAEQRLALAHVALRDAQEQRRAAVTTAAARLAEREARFTTELAAITATRDSLTQQLRDVQAKVTQETEAREALERAIAATQSAAAAAERRFREETAKIAEAGRAERARLEEQISQERREHQLQVAQANSQLRELALEVEQARQAEALTAADVARLAQRESELTAKLGQAEVSLGDAQEQHRAAVTTAATRLSEREAQFTIELAAITATRDGLTQQLGDTEAKLAQETEAREALERAIVAIQSAAAAAERRFREETATIAETARTERARFEEQISQERHEHQLQVAQANSQLRELALEVEQARQAEALTAADVARLAHRESELTAKLGQSEVSLSDAQEQHRAAVTTAATQLSEREAQFTIELAAIAATRDGLTQQLGDVQAKVTQETEAREALERAIAATQSAAAAAERQFREETAKIAETGRAERARLKEQISQERREHQLQVAQADGQLRELALEVEQARQAEALTAADVARLAQRESELTAKLGQAEVLLSDAQEQHRAAVTTAAARLGEREAQFKTELAAIAATRDSLTQQLGDVEAKLGQETEAREALERAIAATQSAAAAAEQRFRDETTRIAETARTERTRLEEQISRERRDHEIQVAQVDGQLRELALEVEQARQAEALAAADVDRLTRRETELTSMLARAEADAATRLAEREARFATELASITATRDGLEQQLADVRARLTDETATRDALARALAQREAELISQLNDATAAHHALDVRLSTAAAALKAADERTTRERLQAAKDREDAEQRFRGDTTRIVENARVERTRLEQQIESLSSGYAAGLARLQASVAERDARIEEKSRHSASLQKKLEAIEAESRRQFEQSPGALCRSTRDGILTDANQAFAALVGYRTPAQLRDTDVAEALFESPDDLAWLIERAVSSGTSQSVETTCSRKNGTRVAVRLSAVAPPSGLIEIAVEDLTTVRVLEDRLKTAHRMEAVGRLGSEIARTCERLLQQIHQEAQRCLILVSGRDGQRAESLLADVTRVGSFLQKLDAFGQEQRAAKAPVDVNQVLQGLEPVLRQVAGDGVALELRTTSSPVHVDVNASRVERLLVNVASYGRERMPSGGRLKIELSTVVVGGKFVAQYPNVRQGPHALITVTEVARPGDAERSSRTGESRAIGVASGRPGVDLGTLQEIITECGGHLWITAEPGGSMVVKMRLPLRAAWEEQGDPLASQLRNVRARVTRRLFSR